MEIYEAVASLCGRAREVLSGLWLVKVTATLQARHTSPSLDVTHML